MALNIKNTEVERLAADVARLTGESKTEAIRRALDERRRRLTHAARGDRRDRVLGFLKKNVWSGLPKAQLGRRLARRRRRHPGLWPGRRVTLDSSALIAVLFAEPGYLDIVDHILEADHVRVGAPTLVETSLVFAGRRRGKAAGEVEGLVRELGITVVPFGEAE